MSLKQEATHCIVNGAYHPFGPPILLRCIWAGEPKCGSLFGKEVMEVAVIKLASIVTL